MKTELKEIDYLKPWALATVCAMVGGFIVGAVVGGLCGFVLGVLHAPMHTIKTVCGLLGFLAGLPISYIFFRIFVSHFIVNKLNAQSSDGIAQPT